MRTRRWLWLHIGWLTTHHYCEEGYSWALIIMTFKLLCCSHYLFIETEDASILILTVQVLNIYTKYFIAL